MKKIGVFTEGRSELIFTRDIILKLFKYEHISVECFVVNGSRQKEAPYPYITKNPDYYFQLVCIGNDEKVLSYIKYRYGSLIKSGFSMILAVRDMYSQEYKKRSNTIDQRISQNFIDQHLCTINTISLPQCSINLYFSIMEFEAWILSMPNLFSKIYSQLSVEMINQNLGFDLRNISPEREFFHPASIMSKIYSLIGEKYDKSISQIESIVGNISETDYEDAIFDDKCPSFCEFYNKIFSLTVK